MYRITPKIKNTSAYICACALFVCGLLLFLFSLRTGLAYALLPQISGAILLVASLYVFGAHIAREFAFEVGQRDIHSHSDLLDFVIYETRGKQSITVCRIGLEDIQKVVIVTGENRKELSREVAGLRRFTYDRTFLPKKQILVITDEDAVKITYSAELLKLLGDVA